MAGKTINELPEVLQLSPNDQLVVRDPEDQSGIYTRRTNIAAIATYVGANVSGISIGSVQGLQGALDGKQPLNAELTTLAALSSTGNLVRTGAATYALRTITGTAGEITVTNGDGVSGNPTLSLPTALTLTGKTATGGTFNSPTLVTPALGVATATDLTVSSMLGKISIYDASGLAGGIGGQLNLQAVSASGTTTYAAVKAYVTNGAVGTQAGDLQILTMTGGTLTAWGRFMSGGTLLFRSGGQLAGAASGTMTLPAGTDTLVGLSLSQALTNKTINGNTFTTGTYTLTGAAGKTFTFSNTLTLTGTDGSTLAIGAGGTLGTNAFTSTAYAPLASPTLTGTPLAPTAATATNTTQIATTAYVQSNLSSYLTTVTAASTYAPLASPALTGTPTAPTVASSADSTTKIATTAFVQSAVAAGVSGVASFNTRTGSVVATAGDYDGVAFGQTGLLVKGATSFGLTIKPNETLTAARTLNLITGDASRTVTLGGDITHAGAFARTLTVTGTTTVTFPTSGTLLSTAAAVTVPQGGTGQASLTNHGIVIGAGTSGVSLTAVGTTGQVLTGVTGADPVWAAPAGGAAFSQVATTGAITGSPATVTFTGITSEDVEIVFNNVVISGSALISLAVSIDNGSTWTTTPVAISAAAYTTASRYGTIPISGLKIGFASGVCAGFTAASGKDAIVSSAGASTQAFSINAGAQINGLRISIGANTFTSGSVLLEGRG